ncbi:MAG: hypothetical protein MRY83_01545 [Flavobacteriales bacterium]|nr:hypothetical protein [Flavobacteriales bacterium]
MNTSDKLKQFIKELKSRGDLIFTECKIGRKTSSQTLAKYQDILPNDLLDFYKSINGFSISWEFLFEKQHRAHLHIPKLSHLPIYKAKQLYIGDLQEEFLEATLIEVDRHQNEAVVYLEPKSQKILLANHTKKNGLALIADNFTAYIEKGLEYGFGWYWMEKTEESIKTKERLQQTPVPPPPLNNGTRIIVVSEMFHLAFHGPGVIIDKDKKHFLVELDYGATFWFTRDEIQHFDYAHPYEICKSKLSTKSPLANQIELVLAYLVKTHMGYCGNGRTNKDISIFLNKRSFLISGLISHYAFQKRMDLLISLLEHCIKHDLKKTFVHSLGTLFLVLHNHALSADVLIISKLLNSTALIQLKKLIDRENFPNLQNDTSLEDFKVYEKFFKQIFEKDKMILDYHLSGLMPPNKAERLISSKYKNNHLIHWK